MASRINVEWFSWNDLLIFYGFKTYEHPYKKLSDVDHEMYGTYSGFKPFAITAAGAKVSCQTEFLLQAKVLERNGRKYRVIDKKLWKQLIKKMI